MTTILRFGNCESSCEIHIGNGVMRSLPDELAKLGCTHAVIIADRNAWTHHGKFVTEILDSSIEFTVVWGPSCEEEKTLEFVHRIAEIISSVASSYSCIVTFGGGLAMNIGGMLAALWLRGVPLLHVPTTLVGMVDAGPSVRHSVDTSFHRNSLGLSYMPRIVLCDPEFLHTLPDIAFRFGFAESIKTALVSDRKQVDTIAKYVRTYNSEGCCDLEDLIIEVVKLKLSLIINDLNEEREAICLHYGHTLGRALENAVGASLPHGAAIVRGMQFASDLSLTLGVMTTDAYDSHSELMTIVQLPWIYGEPSIDNIMQKLNLDHKHRYYKHRKSGVPFVLLKDLGCTCTVSDSPLTYVSQQIILGALRRGYGL